MSVDVDSFWRIPSRVFLDTCVVNMMLDYWTVESRTKEKLPPSAGRRRRLKFSVRTLLVAVTILCVWLGHNLNWIRQRREFIDRPAAFDASHGDDKFVSRARPTAPGLLWLFGEPGVLELVLDTPDMDGELAQEARRLFPEAKVKQMTWNGMYPR